MSRMPNRVRVVVITGAPGAGKTEVGRRLADRWPGPSVVVDTDGLAGISPWQVDERLFALIAGNLRACMRGFLDWGAQCVIVTGVIVPDGTLGQIADLVEDPDLDWRFYGLQATEEVLAARVLADPKFQDPQQRLKWMSINHEIEAIPCIRLIDTTALGLNEVVDAILDSETRQAVRSRRQARRAEVVTVPVGEARLRCTAALRGAGVPASLAGLVVAELIAAELAGCPSHGLQRIPEYIAAVLCGELVPDASPQVRMTGPGTAVIDARRAFGIVAADLVSTQLVRIAEQVGFAVVGLRASGHLGRLGPMARKVTGHGLIVLGFVNCGGAGQKVAPFGGADGRLATNPILIACPAPPGPAVVADLSTSATSEGAIRVEAAFGNSVPAGLLQDGAGNWVSDPAALYEQPPGAVIAPLGGVAAHRGYALSVGVEILAGIVAGAGFSGPRTRPFSNGGLFVAFPATSAGNDLAQIGTEVSMLEEYLASTPVTGQQRPARLPGRRHPHAGADYLTLPSLLWRRLEELSSAPSPPSKELT
jgi:LDH2 family malate/lactate/ureidoglycolate dehydrogenase